MHYPDNPAGAAPPLGTLPARMGRRPPRRSHSCRMALRHLFQPGLAAWQYRQRVVARFRRPRPRLPYYRRRSRKLQSGHGRATNSHSPQQHAHSPKRILSVAVAASRLEQGKTLRLYRQDCRSAVRPLLFFVRGQHELGNRRVRQNNKAGQRSKGTGTRVGCRACRRAAKPRSRNSVYLCQSDGGAQPAARG